MSGIKTFIVGPDKPKRAQPAPAQQGPSADEIRKEADAKEADKQKLARLRVSKSKKGSRQASILNSPQGDTSNAPVLKKTLG